MRNASSLSPAYIVVALYAAPAGAAKVALCHLAADARAHTITVAGTAVTAHLAHGDTIGACPPTCASDEACDDANPCTTDACSADGQCSHTTTDCDDGNPCTADACAPAEGCISTPLEASCDDGNACTEDDACSAGACAGAPVLGCCTADLDCADAHTCTTDTCVGNVCVNQQLTCVVDDICLVAFCDPGNGECATAPTTSPPEALELSCVDEIDNDCDRVIDDTDADCQCQEELLAAVPASFIDIPTRITCLPPEDFIDTPDLEMSFCGGTCGDGLGCPATMTWHDIVAEGSTFSALVDVEISVRMTGSVVGFPIGCTLSAHGDDIPSTLALVATVDEGQVVLAPSAISLDVDLTRTGCASGPTLDPLIDIYVQDNLAAALDDVILADIRGAVEGATCDGP